MGEGRGREVLVCNPRLLEEGFTCITAKIKGLGTIAPVPFQYRRPCTEVGKCDDLHFFPCHLELESTMISKSFLKLHSDSYTKRTRANITYLCCVFFTNHSFRGL